ncbi:MAG: RecB family exonuclease, partial [Nocardioides sp.]
GPGGDHDGVLRELMTEVDRVWSRLQFRTPWSADREREEVRDALSRFLAWHGRPDARPLIGTERGFRVEVTLPDGELVVLHGYADRLELDAQGRIVVIDVKTGKYPPTRAELAEHPQLGLYQLAAEHGAFDSDGGAGVPGGAELWHLRGQAYGRLKVQVQEVQSADERGVRPIERQLMAAGERLRREQFPAQPGEHCRRCDFNAFCPATNAGTVLS